MGLDDLKGQVDFVLAFGVVHELPNIERFFAEVSKVLKPGCRLLLAEPHFQVSEQEFAVTLQMAKQSGFHLNSQPAIRWTRSAVLVKV
jgi:SAM-dependent methyltransferase